jgi:hypothetical protein
MTIFRGEVRIPNLGEEERIYAVKRAINEAMAIWT